MNPCWRVGPWQGILLKATTRPCVRLLALIDTPLHTANDGHVAVALAGARASPVSSVEIG
jgi:hypothetical protein